MNEIENNPIFTAFLRWLEGNEPPDEDSLRKASVSQLWSFLNSHAFNLRVLAIHANNRAKHAMPQAPMPVLERRAHVQCQASIFWGH